MGFPMSAGTDPGIFAAATKDMMAIMARRPLFSSRLCWTFIFSGSLEEKLIGGKTMVGSGPPLV
jgi:hypothetical protein